MNPLFQSNVGELMKEQIAFVPAIIFYLFYVAGIYWFGTVSGIKANSLVFGIISAFALGLLSYGTFEFTNYTILKGWTAQMAIVDTLWGGILSGATAAVGIYVNRFVNG